MGDISRPGRADALRTALANDHETIKQMYQAVIDADLASGPHCDRWRQLAASDAFLATVSRHLGAVEDVLYIAVRRHLPDGKSTARAHGRRAQATERAMRHVLASMYGEVHDLDAPRAQLWRDIHEQLDAHTEAEEELAAVVDDRLTEPQRAALAAKYRARFEHGPTRPHPYTPHSNRFGRISRKIWSLADRALDIMDNRAVPRRPKPPHPKRDSIVSQYLTGSPLFEEHDESQRRDRR